MSKGIQLSVHSINSGEEGVYLGQGAQHVQRPGG